MQRDRYVYPELRSQYDMSKLRIAHYTYKGEVWLIQLHLCIQTYEIQSSLFMQNEYQRLYIQEQQVVGKS